MSQEPGSPQTPSGPVTEALGLRSASSEAVSGGEGKREASVAGHSAHVYLWASLPGSSDPGLREGKPVGRTIPAEIKPAPPTPTPALALACPREGPRLFPPACLSHSQLLTICCPLSSPWGGGSGFKDLEPGVKAKPNHGPQRAPDATAEKERLGLGAAALCARRGCLALRGGQGLRPQGWGVRRWEELPGSGSKL